jgi:predicted nucleic acid-binding protein
MRIKAFVDSNIVIDLIENRDFDKKSIATLFTKAENNEIDLYVSESVIINALYVTGLDEQLLLFLKLVQVVCINSTALQLGLSGNYKDKEDAILYFGALQHKIDYFLTRNKKDFAAFALPIMPVVSAKEFLEKINK